MGDNPCPVPGRQHYSCGEPHNTQPGVSGSAGAVVEVHLILATAVRCPDNHLHRPCQDHCGHEAADGPEASCRRTSIPAAARPWRCRAVESGYLQRQRRPHGETEPVVTPSAQRQSDHCCKRRRPQCSLVGRASALLRHTSSGATLVLRGEATTEGRSQAGKAIDRASLEWIGGQPYCSTGQLSYSSANWSTQSQLSRVIEP